MIHQRVCGLFAAMFILCGVLGAGGKSFASVPYLKIDPKFGPPIQVQNADVTGDGSEDIVALFGDKLDPSSPFYEKLTLVIQNSDDQHLEVIPLQQSGYNPVMNLCDFNDDGASDVMVGTETGGSAGTSDYTIHSVKDGQPMAMPVPMPLNAKGTFTDGYKVSVQIPENERTYMLNVSSRKAKYNKVGIYKKGKLLKPTQASVNAFGKLEPIRDGNDRSCSLIGLQRISGIYNADTIGYIASIWRWDRAGNAWSLLYTSVDAAAAN